MFVAYSHGTPLEEISAVYGVTVSTLNQHIAWEKWAKLRDTMPVSEITGEALVKPLDAVQKLALIQQNRLENLEGWKKLRAEALDIIDQLRAKKLKFEKVFNGKVGIVRAEVEPSTGDLVNIATFLQTVAAGTYRALGDVEPGSRQGQDGPAGSGASAPGITIILPACISKAREISPAEIIDLRPDAVQTIPPGQPPPTP